MRNSGYQPTPQVKTGTKLKVHSKQCLNNSTVLGQEL
jgi:hypothetical protein